MPPSQSPQVSVCIPTYRGAAHIAPAVQSVLSQSLPDFELIVVDDSSPDETLDLVQGFADPRIRVLRNPTNLGAEGNWNRCLQEASGTYFKLLPQDDLLEPTCLERQVAALEHDDSQGLALVFCARTVVDANGRALTVRGYPGEKEGRMDSRSLLRRCLRRGTNLIGEPGAVLFRRSLAETVGPFDATHPYVIDLDYWSRLLVHGDAYYLPEPLVSFRVSSRSWSVRIGASQSRDFRSFMQSIGSHPYYRPTSLDLVAGHVTARLNNIGRLLFYRLHVT